MPHEKIYVSCPVCGKKLCKISTCKGIEIKCIKCKALVEIVVSDNKEAKTHIVEINKTK